MWPKNYWKKDFWHSGYYLADGADDIIGVVPTYISATTGSAPFTIETPKAGFTAPVPQSHKTAQSPSYNAEA